MHDPIEMVRITTNVQKRIHHNTLIEEILSNILTKQVTLFLFFSVNPYYSYTYCKKNTWFFQSWTTLQSSTVVWFYSHFCPTLIVRSHSRRIPSSLYHSLSLVCSFLSSFHLFRAHTQETSTRAIDKGRRKWYKNYCVISLPKQRRRRRRRRRHCLVRCVSWAVATA